MGDEDQEHRYQLVMPFVVCKSQGGPYDDTAFVAGYRLGRLEENLAPRMKAEHDIPLEPADVQQADLIAMRHGYTLDVTRAQDETGVWLVGTFKRIPVAEPIVPE